MRAFAFTLLSLFTAACGAGSSKTHHVKDYRFHLQTNDKELQFQAEDLIATFNHQAGFEALRIVAGSDDANSGLAFADGLYSDQGKLGYGQWITRAAGQGQFGDDRVIYYSMDLQFDAAFMRDHLNSPKDSSRWDELYLLFCHEVGHGLQMEHAPNQDDVMYYTIDGADHAKFAEYFKNVRAFFGR